MVVNTAALGGVLRPGLAKAFAGAFGVAELHYPPSWFAMYMRESHKLDVPYFNTLCQAACLNPGCAKLHSHSDDCAAHPF